MSEQEELPEQEALPKLEFPKLSDWNQRRKFDWLPENRHKVGILMYAGTSCDLCGDPLSIPDQPTRRGGKNPGVQVNCFNKKCEGKTFWMIE